MKKSLLTMALASAAALNLSAQDFTTESFGNYEWTDGDDNEMQGIYGCFKHVSANGKYAVGYDFSGMETYVAFAWAIDQPQDLQIVNNILGRYVGLYDVTNDGLMAGSFYDEEGDIYYPGVCQYGTATWKKLPVPEKYYTGNAYDYDYSNGVNAVTPDGKFLAGTLEVGTGEYKSTIFGTTEVLINTPCLWQLGEDGEYTLTAAYTDLSKNSLAFNEETGTFEAVDSTCYQTFQVWDISNDGQTIVGMNTAGTGGQNPAFIRDGKLYQLFNCGEACPYTGDNYDEEKYNEWGETANFNGGICMSVDANGNIYGYYVTKDEAQKYFSYTADGKLVYLSSLVVAASQDGTQVTNSGSGLYSALDCSEDGRVIVGGSVESTGYGAVNVAAVYYDKTLTGIQQATAANEPVAIDYRTGGDLFINGLYNSAAIYDAQGKLVAEGGQGKAFNLAGKAAGTYVVKVSTKDGMKSFKIAR